VSTNDAADVVRRHAALVAVLALAGLVAALGLLLLQRSLQPQHQATTKLSLSTWRASSELGGPPVGEDPRIVRDPARAVAHLARTPLVLQPVIGRLGLSLSVPELADRIHVETPMSTSVVALSVAGDSDAEALRLDRAVAQQLAQAMTSLAPDGTARTTRSITVVQPARVTEAVGWDPVVTLGGGLLAGVVSGLVVAALREPRRGPGWDRLARR
jgi:capsular polysaccharide biosynthesis protein